MVKSLRAISFTAFISLALAACGGGGGAPAQPEPAPAPSTHISLDQAKELGTNMAAGLQVFGEHGALQIDGNYKNALFRQRGNFSMVNNAEIELSGLTFPILCVRANQPVYWHPIAANGGTFRWRFYSRSGQWANVDWYVFDVGAWWQDTSPGLSVYGEDGGLVFNSNSKPMKMVQQHWIDYNNGLHNDVWLGTTGGTLASCLTGSGVDFNDSGDGMIGHFYAQGVATHYGALQLWGVPVGTIPVQQGPGEGVVSGGGFSIYLVDVAGL